LPQTDLVNGISDVADKMPPRILVVDDIPDQVEGIIHLLEKEHFDVILANSKESALRILEGGTFDIALIDVKLCEEEPNNRDGLYVAERILTLAPEARVIFISRLTSLDVGSLLQMFNRNPELVNGRLAEAYVDKSDPEAVVKMSQLILGAKHGEKYWVPILANAETWKSVKLDLDTKVGKVIRNRRIEFIDGERQCLHILRRLANDDLMPLKEIRIILVNTGRSRTVVLTIKAKYSPTDVERLTVVKIGDREIVEAERVNFIKWVPGFVKFASYPSMTGAAANRQLAGIGYSMVGEVNEPAPTFVEQFWDMAESDSQTVLDEVFHSLLVPKKLPKIVRGSTLWKEYKSRFRQLQDNNILASDLARFCKGCGITVKEGSWTIPLGKVSRTVVRPTDIVNTDFFGPYWVSVVHGDLHGENILVSKDERTLGNKTFLIDFAHIGEHHVFLDYVVMEVSVRMHLLKRLFSRIPDALLDDYIASWVQFEEWLAINENDHGKWEACEALAGKEMLLRLARLILWLRKNAWLHGFNDTYHNYYGALGMACLTSPYLPDNSPDNTRYATRRALLSCAAFSLVKAHNETGRRPLDDAMATRESRDAFLNSLLEVGISRIGQDAKGELRALFRELPRPLLQAAATSGLSIQQQLNDEMPNFSNAAAHVKSSDSLTCSLNQTERSTVINLVVAIKTLESLEHVQMKSIKDELNQWIHKAWIREATNG